MVSTSSSRHDCCRRRKRDRQRRWRRHHTAVTEISPSSGGAPGSGRSRSTGVLCMVGAGAVLLLCSLLAPVAEAMAKNERTESNNLGLLAQACASSYCGVGVNALDLWLSLEERCDNESTPGLTKLWTTGGSGSGAALTDPDGNWSVTSTALVCACVWSVMAYAGFRSGVSAGSKTKGGYPVA